MNFELIFDFFRVFLFWVVLYYIRKKSVNKTSSIYLSDFLVVTLLKYGSATIIISFFLAQNKSYNLFNFLLFILVFFILDLYNFNSIGRIYRRLKNDFKLFILFIVKFIEVNNKFSFFEKYQHDRKISKKEKINILFVTVIAALAINFRFSFYKYDTFLFSELWYYDVLKIQALNNQDWFYIDYNLTGKHVFIDILTKLFKINTEYMVQFYGVIQILFLSIIMFFTIKKVTTNKQNIIPVFTAITFIIGYGFIPISINSITQNQSIYSAFFLLIPTLIITYNPKLILRNYREADILLFVIFIAIGLINMYSLLMLYLPFLIITIIFNYNRKKKFNLVTLFIFSTSLVILFVLNTYFFPYNNFNFSLLIKNSFVKISAFTDNSHLIISNINIIKYINIINFIAILCSITLILLKKNKKRLSIIFAVFYLYLTIMYSLDLFWVDKDLLVIVFSVFSPLLFGISLNVIFEFIGYFSARTTTILSATFSFTLLFYISNKQSNILSTKKETSNLKREILANYSAIVRNHLPNTYAIVNSKEIEPIANKLHYYIDNKDFINNYLTRDSIYFANKNDRDFLKKNPEIILPETIFLFNKKAENNSINKQVLDSLKIRGRNIYTFKQTKHLIIYKVENTHKGSKIIDKFY